MILCLYVEVPQELGQIADFSAIIRAVMLKEFCARTFDATQFDSYTSGSCKVDSIDEIEEDLRTFWGS